MLDVAGLAGGPTGAAAPTGAAVRRWAASVWAAWSAHHHAIRERTDEVAPRRG